MAGAVAWLYWRGDDSLTYRVQLESENKKEIKAMLRFFPDWLSVGESVSTPNSSKIHILQSEFQNTKEWRSFLNSSELEIEFQKG